jgi:hypothetical protein
MSKLSLTRFLYFFEEVKISLMMSILQKKSLKECYFWISELFYSGFQNECYTLLWKIYYDFYYLSNKNIENEIIKKTTTVLTFKSKSNDLNILRLYMKIATILFNCQACPTIFLYRISCKNLSSGNVKETLEKNLKKNDYANTSSLIKKLSEIDLKTCVKVLETFKNDKFCDNKYYDNKFHLLLCFSSKNYLQQSNYKLKFILKNFDDIKKLNNPITNVWKTLNKKRLYKINDTMGCFAVGTNQNNCNKKKIWGEFWEHFAKKTPLWEERLKDNNGYFKGKNLCFKTIDDQETFYNMYNYEPDEKIDNFIVLPKKTTVSKWILHTFDIAISRTLSCCLPKQPIEY